MRSRGPTLGVLPDLSRQAGRILAYGLVQQCFDVGDVEGKVWRVDLCDNTTTAQPLEGERQLASRYQDQM